MYVCKQIAELYTLCLQATDTYRLNVKALAVWVTSEIRSSSTKVLPENRIKRLLNKSMCRRSTGCRLYNQIAVGWVLLSSGYESKCRMWTRHPQLHADLIGRTAKRSQPAAKRQFSAPKRGN